MKYTTHPTKLLGNYPAKAVRIIEPFGAGGGPDLLARVLAQQLHELWGQRVTVENITGAGATAGPAQVARAPADGYTLLINTSAQAYSATLQNLPYDPLRDFIPVIPLTSQPYVLVAGKSAGVTTVGELVAAAKAKPGKLVFGSTGAGTGTHVGVEQFNQSAGIKAQHLPPRPTDSNANTLTNVIAGHTTYCILPIELALPAIREGKLMALGVTTTHRSMLLPQVPTIAEAGLTGFTFPIWYGVWVPTGTPIGLVEKLVRDIGRVMAKQPIRDWIDQHGGDPMTMTQPEFVRFVLSESERASQILKAPGS